MTKYVIIGIGAAGISAASAIRGQDPDGEILMIGDEADGYYSRPGLAYYLANEIPEDSLFPFRDKDFKNLSIRRLHDRVNAILPQEHMLKTTKGKTIKYDKLLIAVGAAAARANLPGANLTGVFKLDNINDTRKIIQYARKAKTAVVVGGGITALEIVEGLIARKVKVHYFLRGDRYWGNVLDKTESKIIEWRLKKEGVHIHYHTEAEEIIGKKDRVVGVRTKNGEGLRCEIVGIAIGIQPRLKLAQASGINIDRGILVNEYLQTNQPDIFAAGDVAQVLDPITGETILDSLWNPARMQGHNAGLNMSGQREPYRKEVPFNVTRLAGLTTTIIGQVGRGVDEDLVGIARGDSETWRKIPDAIASQSNFEVNRLRLMVGENTLLGAVIMGDQTLSKYLQEIVVNQVDISPIRDQLLAAKSPIADIISNFWIPQRGQNAA